MTYEIGNQKRNFEDVEDEVIGDILSYCLAFRDGDAGTMDTIRSIIKVLETYGEKVD